MRERQSKYEFLSKMMMETESDKLAEDTVRDVLLLHKYVHEQPLWDYEKITLLYRVTRRRQLRCLPTLAPAGVK